MTRGKVRSCAEKWLEKIPQKQKRPLSAHYFLVYVQLWGFYFLRQVGYGCGMNKIYWDFLSEVQRRRDVSTEEIRRG